MIDKNSLMIINRSVLGQAPFTASISVVGISLIILFTVIEPSASSGLGFWDRFVFWGAQVSMSLLGIFVASLLIRRLATTNIPNVALIFITGAVASAIVSPGFILIEQLFPSLDRVPDSKLDELALTNWFAALFVETIEVMPTLVITWFIVNIPIMLNSTFVKEVDSDATQGLKLVNNEQPSVAQAQKETEKKLFYAKLPENIGREIMYISSDLHYLHVTTTKGSALVLGSVSKIADIFDEEGFLVHRSHWVNKDFVTRVAISGNVANCVMKDQKKIPISRSKRKLLKAYFGSGYQDNMSQKQQDLYSTK